MALGREFVFRLLVSGYVVILEWTCSHESGHHSADETEKNQVGMLTLIF
jgi:hypothetical protein